MIAQQKHVLGPDGYSEAVDLTPEERADLAAAASTATDAAAREARARRDALLLASDWTQLPDSPLDPEQITAWQTYRQALRDVPQQAGFPLTVAWPDPPVPLAQQQKEQIEALRAKVAELEAAVS